MSSPEGLVTKTFTAAEMGAMDPDERLSLLLSAVEIKGTAVVRKADGTIRYSKDAKPGDYGESAEDLKAAGVI